MLSSALQKDGLTDSKFETTLDSLYCRATNIAQQKPADRELKIRNFHQEILRVVTTEGGEGTSGKFSFSTIANVDQTPLPFTFNKGQGYDETGAKTVWHCGAQSGLDKRQCTVQLTTFADGEPRIKPLHIFQGKGLRISQTDQVCWCQVPGECLVWWNHHALLNFQHVEMTFCYRSTMSKAPHCWCSQGTEDPSNYGQTGKRVQDRSCACPSRLYKSRPATGCCIQWGVQKCDRSTPDWAHAWTLKRVHQQQSICFCTVYAFWQALIHWRKQAKKREQIWLKEERQKALGLSKGCTEAKKNYHIVL